MRRLLHAILMLSGSAAALVALGHIAFGPPFIPGVIPVNPTMDSEDRFYASMFLGFGVALLWSAGSIERRAAAIRFLSAVFFVGGCARVVSAILVGSPNRFFQAMTVMELLLPIVIWFLLASIGGLGSDREAAPTNGGDP